MSLQTRLTDLIAAVGADIKSLRSRVTVVEGATGAPLVNAIEAWHVVGAVGEPAFQNSWTHHDPAIYVVKFRKMPDGSVQLRGLTRGGATGTVAFTLPVGYRPDEILYIPATEQTGSQSFTINTDGRVSPNVASTGNWFSFSDATFDTGQTSFPVSNVSVPLEAWHRVGAAGEPVYRGTWLEYDANNPVRFRKYPDGRVRLTGATNGGINGTTAFVLPVGYRPLTSVSFPVVSNAVSGYVVIGTDGSVTPTAASGFAVLDLEFDTGQTTFPTAITVASVTQEAWHVIGAAGEPAFQNGYQWHGTFARPAFRKTPDGTVRIRGLIKGTGTAGPAFTLPAGYRPSEARMFASRASFGAGPTEQAGRFDISTTGDVTPQNPIPAGGFQTIEAEFDVDPTTFPAAKTIVPVVNALPNGATEDDEIYYQTAAMAAAGVMWRLKYKALGNASAYKWQFVGGGPLFRQGTKLSWNDRSAANNTANFFLDATAPSITVPLAGDYDVDMSASCVTNNGTAAPGLYAGTSIPPASWPDSDVIASGQVAAGGVWPLFATKQLYGLAAAAVVNLYFSNANIGGSVSYYNARLRLTPVRVG